MNRYSERINLSSSENFLEGLGNKEEAKDPVIKQPTAKRVTRSQAKASKNEEDKHLKRKNKSSSNAKSEEDSVKSRLRSASSQSPEKKSVVIMKEEEVQDSTEKRLTKKSKAIVKKNVLTNSVVRRTSKRLAGIELEPTPELNTRAKSQRIVPLDDGTPGKCKQPVNLAATGGDINFDKELAKSYSEDSSPKPNATSSNGLSAGMEAQIEKICKPVGRSGSGENKKMKTPLVMISEAEVNPVFHLDGYKHKKEMSPVSPLSRQTSATNSEKSNKVTFPKATAISPSRSSSKAEHPSHSFDNSNKLSSDPFKSSVVRGTCSEVVEKNTTNNSFFSSSSSSSAFDSTLADLWKDPCIAFAIKTLTGESLRLPEDTAATSSDQNNNHSKQKGVTFSPETPGDNVNTGSANPVFAIWKDPCIEFAIKTLTGAIPIGLEEPDARLKPNAAAMQEQEGRQSSSCGDNLVQQCSSNIMKKKNKTVIGKSGDLKFTQSFYKD